MRSLRRWWGGHRSKLMIGVIARQTILEHLLSFRFFAGCAIAFGLIATTTLVRISQFNRQLALYHIERQQVQREQERTTVASSLELKIVRPPEVLSIFVQGPLPPARQVATVDYFSMRQEPFVSAGGNPFLALASRLDLNGLVMYIFSVLVLFLTYDAICGERERGTLRVILAHGASRQHIVLGKWIGALAVLSVPLGGAAMISLLLVERFCALPLASTDYGRILMIVAVYFFFLGLMGLLGLWISALAKDSVHSLLLCLSVWSLIVLLWPSAVTHFHQMGAPPRISHQVIHAQRIAEERAFRQQVEELLFQFLDELRRVLPGRRIRFGWDGTQMLFRNIPPEVEPLIERYVLKVVSLREKMEQRREQLLEEYARELQHRQRRADRILSFSPASLCERLVWSLSGTSAEDADHFSDLARAYQKTVRRVLHTLAPPTSRRWYSDDPPGNPGSMIEQFGEFLSTGPDPQRSFSWRLPEFHYYRRPLSRILAHHWLDIAGFLLAAPALYLLAYYAAVRADVR